ncbi:MAG TPA: poly(R)-hydroxyalkanoic acid synthase subunit PhaE [Candidatus Limnocylindrales bacterium]|nr:poly(R)-hydroxyalkanoic acid synthase subunit PhaE [Candidatus Limnocylindrales bacterium]
MDDRNLESPHEFFDLWVKTYEATFGKISEIPTIGPLREKSEKMSRGLPIFFSLYSTWMDTIYDFQTISQEAMNRMNTKTVSMEGKTGVENYKELYNSWIESYSETFKEFLKSGHFSSDMGKFMSNFLDVQKYNREMLEENYLKPNNLPTKSDIDELTKELYSLKKLVKELSCKITEMSENK